MGRKSQWFIYLTFPSPDVVEGHWTMASSHCYSVTPLVIADHVEPALNIITSNRWDLTCLHDVKINLQCHWVINISARTEIWFKKSISCQFSYLAFSKQTQLMFDTLPQNHIRFIYFYYAVLNTWVESGNNLCDNHQVPECPCAYLVYSGTPQ